MIEALIVKALKKLVVRLPFRTIETDGRPYLTRWYLWPGKPRSGPDDNGIDLPFAVFIHYFHRGDEDRDQHNHPWDASVALVLAGGYREERGNETHVYKPGSVNVIKGDDFHRVDLLDPKKGSWSLFIAGRNVQSWGFKLRDTGEFVPWQRYLDVVRRMRAKEN